jgi:hypothetical protein
MPRDWGCGLNPIETIAGAAIHFSSAVPLGESNTPDPLGPLGNSLERRLRSRYGTILLLICSLYLAANLFANPETPFLIGGDHMFFWMRAQQMFYGEHIYRDFFEFTPPGTDLIYLCAFELFGPRIWVLNLIVLLLGVSLSWLCWRIASSIMKPAQAALTVALFVVMVYGKLLNGTHHFFSLLAVLGALAVIIETRTPLRMAAAGVLLGVAAFITQTRGPMAALAVSGYLLWERVQLEEPWRSQMKRQMLLITSLVVTWTVLSSYLIATIGLRKLWFFQITYPSHFEAVGWGRSGIGIPETLSWAAAPEVFRALFAYVLVPAVYLISIWLCYSKRRAVALDTRLRVALIAALGTSMFVEILPSATWFRFYCVSAPAVILLVWLLGRTASNRSTVYATSLLFAALLGLASHQTLSRHTQAPIITELPGGRAALTPGQAEQLTWLAVHTRPGQFLFQAGWPGVYLPLSVRNPLFLDKLQSDRRNRLGYLQLSTRQLQAKQVQYILWSHDLNARASDWAVFYDFLQKHYRRVWTFSDQDEVWERKTPP